MNITEIFKNPFVKNNKPDENLSYTSDSENVDIEFTGKVEEFEYGDTHSIHRRQGRTNLEKEYNATVVDSLIRNYRDISEDPEISSAIDEIVNDCISENYKGSVAPTITFKDDASTAKNIQKMIVDEHWGDVLGLVNFEKRGEELFRKWYIDSKLIAELVYNNKNVKEGIKEVLILDPIGFRKKHDDNGRVIYEYDKKNVNKNWYSNIFRSSNLEEDTYKYEQIAIADSGLKDKSYTYSIGYLHYALKTARNMSMIEDSFVIYRMLRAVEKRIWNIDVGKMPKTKAVNYLNKVMNEVSSDRYYDNNTGELKGKNATNAITEDFVFPTRNGKVSTSVETIGGDSSFIDNLDDHEMFLKKLYVAMKIPVNRLDDTSSFDFTSTDELRAEIKFNKFTNRLRSKYSIFCLEILKFQLLSKNIIANLTEWEEIKNDIIVKWDSNNQIIQNAEIENFKTKVESMDDMESGGILGKYLSRQTTMEMILGMSKEEFEEERKKIEEEKSYFPDEDDN